MLHVKMFKLQKFILKSSIKFIFGPNNRSFSKLNNIQISAEVEDALVNRKPIVALESTIITHGMPFPNNLECAIGVENVIRKKGVTPATVAILGGKVHVGLNYEQMSMLADTKLTKSVKTSRRDFGFVISNNLNGGTTVSGTIIVANQVGIPIFATGGIGGVHRDGENSLDISADLTELGRNPISVVSAGVKSILDIPRTLEYLETQGVLVATYGASKDFPAFYTRTSGVQSPYNVSTPEQAASIIHACLQFRLNSGLLFAVPLPSEDALDENEIEMAIKEALHMAKERGICGKEITPFLLQHIGVITRGKSLKTNIALIKNNAKVAADIAVELSKLRKKDDSSCQDVGSSSAEPVSASTVGPVIIGGSIMDCCATINEGAIKLDGSLHGCKFSYSSGGVARNICDALVKLGVDPLPRFLTAVGDDSPGEILRSLLPQECTQLMVKATDGTATAQTVVVLSSEGDCEFIVGDMDVHKKITPSTVMKQEELMKQSPLLVLDANLPLDTLSCALKIAQKHQIPVFYEPTDIAVADKAFLTQYWKRIEYVSPNLAELCVIARSLNIPMLNSYDNKIIQAAHISKQLAYYINTVIVTLGPLGVLVTSKLNVNNSFLNGFLEDDVQVRYYPCPNVKNIVNVSGAGDCLASGIISGMLAGLNEAQCVSVGFAAANLALNSESAVPTKLFDNTDTSWSKNAVYKIIE